ncbi:MAG: GAF domain-containing sensor histidine kinase [Armatimonadetes bacterium]|nr:GAF domain-containing sensor histidine kinase [Armatimonadota bacterium]
MTDTFSPVLAVGVGIHLAVTLFLLARYLEGRERPLAWWTVAYFLFTAHVGMEMALGVTSASWPTLLRHATFMLAAWAMIRSFGRFVGVGVASLFALLLAAWLLPRSWVAAAVPPSLVGGVGFVATAFLFRKAEGGLHESSDYLLFWGLVLTGLHAFDYPFIRLHPQWAILGMWVSGVFTMAFGLGIALRAWGRARELAAVSAVAEGLNRSFDMESALRTSLREVVGRLGLRGGWVFLATPEGGARLAAAHFPPDGIVVTRPESAAAECRCLEWMRQGHPGDTVRVMECEQGGPLGVGPTRHVTVALRVADGVVGVMNLLLPDRRVLTSREMQILSALGNQIGLAVERARLYEEAKVREALRGDLLKKLISAQEDERRRIARELHDEAGQALTALILNLEMAERAAQGEEQLRLQRLRTIAEQTLSEIRKLIYDLRPTILDDLGLPAAIRWYVKESVERQGVQVAVHLSGLERRLPGHMETAVFRIIQEALTNVVKHAGATRATVRVDASAGQITLAVEDNGRGFQAAVTRTASVDGGMGLIGMRERAELLGGQWHVRSAPGQGTAVTVKIPLPAAAPA